MLYQRKYVSKRRSYIKIDVRFRPLNVDKESTGDVIQKISKPYLAMSVTGNIHNQKTTQEWSGCDIDSSIAQSPQGTAGERDQLLSAGKSFNLRIREAAGIFFHLKTIRLGKDFWLPV